MRPSQEEENLSEKRRNICWYWEDRLAVSSLSGTVPISGNEIPFRPRHLWVFSFVRGIQGRLDPAMHEIPGVWLSGNW